MRKGSKEAIFAEMLSFYDLADADGDLARVVEAVSISWVLT